jgi:cold shock CspA family protein
MSGVGIVSDMRIGKMNGPQPAANGIRTKGTIVRLIIGQSYGFIRLRDRREVFFHRADVQEGTPFNSLQVGHLVAFELIVDAVSGPRGVRVSRATRAANK